MADGMSGKAQPGTGASWATATSGAARPNLRQRLARRRERVSLFDWLVLAAAVAAFDLIGVLAVSGWQSIRCGDACGMRTQLHLMRLAAVLMLLAVALPPVLVAALARRGRLVVATVQALLVIGVLVNVLSTQHRLLPRINGTAPCWNPLYSAADCPWGSKD